MNKIYNVLAKLVLLIFLILLIVGIVFSSLGVKKVKASDSSLGQILASAVVEGVRSVKVIDTPTIIQGNQFWSADFDYKITSSVTIPASSSLSIESGANISVNNNAYFNVDGGILNIGFLTDTNGRVSGLGLTDSVNIESIDSFFDSLFYKTQSSFVSKIIISGIGYNNIFSVNNGGILNIRKTDIKGVSSSNTSNGSSGLERTLFGVYKKSLLNILEVNINDINVNGTQAFCASDNSRIILYRSSINSLAGNAFANIFNSSVLNVFRTKINDATVGGGIKIFSKSYLNFQKSSISAKPLVLNNSNSGTCFSGYTGTNINVLDSDIGPCLIAFNLSGAGNFKINQNNISQNGDVVLNFSPSVDFRNNWWGSTSGPKNVDLSTLDPDGNYSDADYIKVIKNQNAIEDYLNGVISTPFSPVPFGEVTPCCSSVLFIPGIQGSRLYKKGLFGTENQLWEPNRNKDVEYLVLDSSGLTRDSSIYTRDIITKTNFLGPVGATDIYQGLLDYLSKEKTDKNIDDFQTLAHDWRFLPSSILSSGIKTDSYTVMLKDKIKEMAKKSGSGKVIIVAHSYGGLLAKSLMQDLEKEGSSDLIESVVLVSVPEYGTPQSITSTFNGDNEDLLGGLILTKATSMALGKNMLSAHLLLPSPSYFTESDGVYNQKNIIGFDSWVSSKYKLGTTKIDSFSQMVDLFKNKNIVSKTPINNAVFDTAEAEHGLIDNYSANLSTKTYSIVAVGVPTLSNITYVKPKCRGFLFCSPKSVGTPDFTRKYSLMGDGVVIAHNLASRSGSVFTADIGKENDIKKTSPVFFKEDPISHKDVFRSSGVKDILHAILSKSKKASQMINSFGLLSNPYVSYVSGSLSKPGPILGSYGNSSIFTGISKIADTASDSDFAQRFNDSKILITEAYGPISLSVNYKNIMDLQNKPFDLLSLSNRIVNYTNYSDGNRVGVVSVIPTIYSGINVDGNGGGSGNTGGNGINIFGQGSGVGIVQIVTKVDSKEIIYPPTSVTQSTGVDINYSTTTIAIDNNGDGIPDKIIAPIQINNGTSTDSADVATSTESIDDLFVKAKDRIHKFVNGGGTVGGTRADTNTGSIIVTGTSTITSADTNTGSIIVTGTSTITSAGTIIAPSTLLSSSSIYLANKYIDKLDISQRKYQGAGILQSLKQLQSFYDTMEVNMNTISNLIITYNKQQNFYVFNNFLTTNKKVLFLNQRQKEIREEILVYLEIHDAFSDLMQKMGEGL